MAEECCEERERRERETILGNYSVFLAFYFIFSGAAALRCPQINRRDSEARTSGKATPAEIERCY